MFIGDFIDRHPARGVLAIVRPMVEVGTALAVMGNHELNAIGYHQSHPEVDDEYLRPRIDKNRRQHAVFRAEFESQPDALDDTVACVPYTQLGMSQAWRGCTVARTSGRD